MPKNIGRRIYYDKQTGEIILDTGDKEGVVVVSTVEQDIASYQALSERNRETFDVLELEYSQYAQDFEKAVGRRVDPETKTLEFSYPDPNEPEVEQPYQVPLSEQIAALEKENKLFKAQNQALTDKTNFHDEVLTEIILAINS